MEETIVSSSNKLYKRLKSLQIKKYRDDLSEYTIEGIKMLREAKAADVEIKEVIFLEDFTRNEELSELYNELKNKKIKCTIFCKKIFCEVNNTESPQGVMAIVKKYIHNFDETVIKGRKQKLILLDEIQDPGNLGTIIRTADAFGVDGLILSAGCVDLYNSKVLRATMGSVFHLPILTNINLYNLLPILHEKGFTTIATDPYGEDFIAEVKPDSKIAIIIGNEANGIKGNLEELAMHRVRIPMDGNAESLNAGIAAGIAIYELCVRK